MSGIGEVLKTARQAKGMTQGELAEAAQMTQAALSRYENDLRAPEPEALERLARALGVTPDLLGRGVRIEGGIAVAAHMRRRATAKPTVWRALEARLNMLRLHTTALHEEINMSSDRHVPSFDPDVDPPEYAARMVRVQWRLPIGPVHSLSPWMEAAGVLIAEADFGAGAKVDGLSQWATDYPIVMLNSSSPSDKKRLTLAHELGHLVLHSQYGGDDMEQQANAFAAELLMPEAEIRPMLRGRLTLGKFVDLKRYWGTSIQSLIERAYSLDLITRDERTSFWKQLSARGWRTNEPASDEIPVENPRLTRHIADSLEARGLTASEIATLSGFHRPADNDIFVGSRKRGHLTSA